MQKMKANLVGLVVLSILVAITSLLVPSTEVAKPMWIFAYALWVVCALFVWHHKLAPDQPRRWLLMAVGSVAGAALWFGFANLVSRIAFGVDEPGLSRLFDVGVALMIAPGLAFIAIAGWARALFMASAT
ncbi:hypothetical protein NWF24_25060 [Variovorax paradoxus]|uniref:hypothetical protein n=1 Tax=Variovorax paradoxus TaxID=34073 RepID=UPI0021AD37B1|nr:hypothetical protein [Variovorax paradoxus]UVH56089.1 hypothetical protein NWF24_25060 [Variovorax paradoxus]